MLFRRMMSVPVKVLSNNRTSRSANRSLLSSSTSTSTSASTKFKPWPNGITVIESNGDYRNESWLEEYIGGPLYTQQSSLPKLPVIDSIETTIQRFLPTAVPLIRSDEERIALQIAINKFPNQAKQLHKRLVQRKEEFNNSSWLQLWWNQLGYLQVRDSNVINVSYFFHFQDDTTIFSKTQSTTKQQHSVVPPANVKRAASVITGLAEYRQLVCSGQLPVECIGKGTNTTPLCSTAFKHMFHATRIPKLVQDSVLLYDPSQYNHCIVIRKGIYYTMDFCDTNGNLYSIDSLEAGLQEILNKADSVDLSTVTRLGYMTGINRDNAAMLRQALLNAGGDEMQHSLDVLQSGAFVICLDDVSPVSRVQCANMLLHGNAGNGIDAQGYNRWFDKSVQLVIANNGKTGFVGEHSMMDGMPQVGLANHITKTTYKSCQMKTGVTGSCNVKEIFSPLVLNKINTTVETANLLKKAKDEFDQLVLQNSLHVQCFHGYGSDFMKKSGFSPDAYVQMAMQLAAYRLWGEQVGTYESTQVRPFLHGRTETTRTVSEQSSAFCKRYGLYPLNDIDDNDIARREKVQLLKDAVQAHVKYIGLAAKGQGVDRHFFGLSMLVQDGEDVPDLYNDPVFQRSKRWRVSTSHLTHPKFDGWGYGQVVPDGVGLAYSIHQRHCVFNITALAETGWTEKLSQLLEEALLEMRSVVEMEHAASVPPQSKL